MVSPKYNLKEPLGALCPGSYVTLKNYYLFYFFICKIRGNSGLIFFYYNNKFITLELEG